MAVTFEEFYKDVMNQNKRENDIARYIKPLLNAAYNAGRLYGVEEMGDFMSSYINTADEKA
jgi:hypothetical protein